MIKQSRLASWLETCGSTATGFVVSLAIQYGVCWWYGLPLALHDNLGIIGVFTIASLIRSYGWRRLMETFQIRRPLSPFMLAVIAERYRQIEVEGWSAEHDDKRYRAGELALAGSAYANTAHIHLLNGEGLLTWAERKPSFWPWSLDWWKPTGFRRDLVKACALIIADGERFDRQKTKPEPVS